MTPAHRRRPASAGAAKPGPLSLSALPNKKRMRAREYNYTRARGTNPQTPERPSRLGLRCASTWPSDSAEGNEGKTPRRGGSPSDARIGRTAKRVRALQRPQALSSRPLGPLRDRLTPPPRRRAKMAESGTRPRAPACGEPSERQASSFPALRAAEAAASVCTR